ncbi:MAG TPA: hypothetical protein PLM49_03040, partial [Bacteroidales bacterium]|nr:hypothetical protein [Bacteroidales bacterium]
MRTHVKIHTDCNNNKSRCSSSSRKKVTLGLFLVAAGILLILGRSGLIEPKHMEYIFSWQSLLVALGVLFLISNPRSVVFSSILILVGGFFLYSEIVSLPIETRNIFWPIILVLLGLVMIFKRFSHKTPKKTFDHVESFSDEYVDKNIVFGGSKTVVTSKNFRGGSISTVFGGCELILTEAGLAEGIDHHVAAPVIDRAHFRDIRAVAVERGGGRNLDRRECTIVEVGFDAGERRDQLFVADGETHAPARHGEGFRHRGELDCYVDCTGHLQHGGRRIAVEIDFRIG